jgi:acetyl-CoA carboxylase carboxyltransferase component
MTSIALRAGVPSIVRVATRLIDERPVVWVDVDASERQGALSSASSEQIAAGADFALHQRVPLVVVVRSSGADINEGIAALHGWGHAARALANCSGIVPVVMIVDGPAVSGPALLLGLADLVVMTEASYAFVSGPTMVAEFTGVVVDHDELGGAATHARYVHLNRGQSTYGARALRSRRTCETGHQQASTVQCTSRRQTGPWT